MARSNNVRRAETTDGLAYGFLQLFVNKGVRMFTALIY